MQPDRGFIIGNGESRKGFDLEKLRGLGPIYGCNALYRDFMPDTLIAVDKRMISEIRDSNVITNGIEFIWREHDSVNITHKLLSTTGETLQDLGSAAGPTALEVMCSRYPTMVQIFLVGFDIFSKTGKVNNIYKGTSCYKDADSKPTYTQNWTEKLRQVFVKYDKTLFIRVCDNELNEEYKVPAWRGVTNISYINYEIFKRLLDLIRSVHEPYNPI